MKEKKDKKGKQLESTIGKIIYGFLLFAPLLVCLTTSMYAIFNKNAYQSYYGETINQAEQQYPTSNSELVQGKEYYYFNTRLNNTEYSGTISYTHIEFVTANMDITTEQRNFINNSVKMYFYKGTSTTFYDSENNSQNINPNGLTVKITFQGTTSNSAYRALYSQTYNSYSYIDNNFEYGLYKAENSTLFNWSKNTAIYTILSTTCVGLGITNTFTPFLMAYWLLISVIYFIYDIGLMLIMVMHRKIHEMQEGI